MIGSLRRQGVPQDAGAENTRRGITCRRYRGWGHRRLHCIIFVRIVKPPCFVESPEVSAFAALYERELDSGVLACQARLSRGGSTFSLPCFVVPPLGTLTSHARFPLSPVGSKRSEEVLGTHTRAHT